MPQINTHYVSGPIDKLVYEAAEAAGLPDLVVAGFDGEALAWRWNVARAAIQEARDILLRIAVAVPGVAIVEISVIATSPQVRNHDRSRVVSRRQEASPAAIDPEWLAVNLRKAHETALQL